MNGTTLGISRLPGIARGLPVQSAVLTLLVAGLMFVSLPLAARASVVGSVKPAVVRGNDWFLRNSLTSGFADIAFKYGIAGDTPLMGDWDGDGTRTPGVVRGNTWYLRNSNTTGFAEVVFSYGVVGDLPIVGDWDGDSVETPGVVRVRSGCGPYDCVLTPSEWHLRNTNSTGNADASFFGFGDHTSSPVSGNWDGDGDDNPGTRGSFTDGNSWYLDTGTDGSSDITFQFGSRHDVAIVGDWDGDTIASAGVVRGNVWYLRNALTSGVADTSFQYGRDGDRFLVWQ